MTRGIRLLWSSPRTRDTHTCCRAFGCGAVTTSFNDLGLSQLGFEHPTFRLRGKRSNPLRHSRGKTVGVSKKQSQYNNSVKKENMANNAIEHWDIFFGGGGGNNHFLL